MAGGSGDRLLSITPASGNAASFTFDALGRFKTRAVTGSTTETYSYLGTADEGWGEAASIGRASATETAAQAAAVKCTQTRLGASCQTAQQQADAAATTAGIGDAFGDIWNSALHLGSCVGNILNCADVGLGLAMTVTNPGGTSQAMAAQRWAAIQSGDKRAGAHAITSTLIDFASILPLFGALKAATVADAGLVTDWSTFPDVALAPRGSSLRILPDGAGYDAARASANMANRLVRADARAAGIDPTGMEVHEKLPVKFGGDPVDPNNKVLLPAEIHREITSWWAALLRSMEGGG